MYISKEAIGPFSLSLFDILPLAELVSRQYQDVHTVCTDYSYNRHYCQTDLKHNIYISIVTNRAEVSNELKLFILLHNGQTQNM